MDYKNDLENSKRY